MTDTVHHHSCWLGHTGPHNDRHLAAISFWNGSALGVFRCVRRSVLFFHSPAAMSGECQLSDLNAWHGAFDRRQPVETMLTKGLSVLPITIIPFLEPTLWVKVSCIGFCVSAMTLTKLSLKRYDLWFQGRLSPETGDLPTSRR